MCDVRRGCPCLDERCAEARAIASKSAGRREPGGCSRGVEPLWSAEAELPLLPRGGSLSRHSFSEARCRRGPEAPVKQQNKKAEVFCFAKALRNAGSRKDKAASSRRTPKRRDAAGAKAKAAASLLHSKAASPQGELPYLRNYRAVKIIAVQELVLATRTFPEFPRFFT